MAESATPVDMPLSASTRLGPHDIVGALYAGGLGEVYRARDTKLGRDVAAFATVGVTRLIASRLFGVSAADPATIAIGTVLVVLAAALVAALPARRAARVDPMVALRAE